MAATRLRRATAWQATRRPPEELIDLRVQPIRVHSRFTLLSPRTGSSTGDEGSRSQSGPTSILPMIGIFFPRFSRHWKTDEFRDDPRLSSCFAPFCFPLQLCVNFSGGDPPSPGYGVAGYTPPSRRMVPYFLFRAFRVFRSCSSFVAAPGHKCWPFMLSIPASHEKIPPTVGRRSPWLSC